jgi:chitin disaccharide deacetylase
MNRPARLIVNADDFGLCKSINEAIRIGHDRGIVTSCSLIPPKSESGPEWIEPFEDAVVIARDMPTLDVGLHFALVGRAGEPRGYAEFLAAYCAGRYPASRIERRLNRQIDRLERAGIHPSHIDSHQHLHALSGVMRSVCKVAVQRGIRAIRLPLELSPSSAPRRRILAAKALGIFAAASRKIIDRAGLWRPDYFLGMASSGHLDRHAILGLIDRVPTEGVTEIVCHPGADNLRLSREFAWGYDWEAEYEAVTSDLAIKRLQVREIELTNFAIEAAIKP